MAYKAKFKSRKPRSKFKSRRPWRKKVCKFCTENITQIDYKDMAKLQKFVTERGKIVPSRISGACASHQRKITRAIKKARAVALLPFVGE